MHGERSVYDSDWVSLRLTDVEIPGMRRFEHHVVRVPFPAVGVVVHDEARGVLLLWRHRFITGTWGYEVPAGRVEAGETLEEAAVREVREETGWVPTGLRLMHAFHPTNGLSDHRFVLFLADGAEQVGEPEHPEESERVEWLPAEEVVARLRAGEVLDGLSLAALLWWTAFERAGPSPAR